MWRPNLRFERWMAPLGVLVGVAFGFTGVLMFGPAMGVAGGLVDGILAFLGFAEARASRDER